ncbi:hypothetical protein ACP275_11G122000 [Erythranthe tilingii]
MFFIVFCCLLSLFFASNALEAICHGLFWASVYADSYTVSEQSLKVEREWPSDSDRGTRIRLKTLRMPWHFSNSLALILTFALLPPLFASLLYKFG